MRWLRVMVLRIRALVSGNRLDAEAREEIQQHVDRQMAANLAAGMDAGAARRAAVLDVGSVAQLADASREARGLGWWDVLRTDLRYTVRQIRRRPGFSSAVILTMAIGVGATSAVFAVVDSVVLRPLPYPKADRLYALFEVNSRSNVGRTRTTPLNFFDWRDQAASFDGMAAQIGTGFTLTGRGSPEFSLGSMVTTDLLDVLGIQPIMGRTFRPEEEEAGKHRVAILTYGLWTSYFGADPSVVNHATTINNQSYEIVGVLPPSFAFPSEEYRLLVPLVTKGQLPGGLPMTRSARFLRVVGRLRAGVTEASARQELDAIGSRLAEAYPGTNDAVTIGMKSLRADIVGNARSNLFMVLTAVGFVLLMACVNVAGLSLARGQARGRELALRTAIGASRARLVRQLGTEGLVLFLIGGAAGLAIAAWVVGTLSATLPHSIPRVQEIRIDGRFIAIASAVVLIAGLISSILPALQVTGRTPSPRETRSRGVVSPTRSAQRARSVLLVAQIAVAVVLVAGASLALRSLSRVWQADTGFRTEHTMTFGFVMRDTRYPTAATAHAFLDRALASLQATPGVAAAGVTTHLPLSDNNFENSFTVEGATTDGREPPVAGLRFVLGDYLDAIGARVLDGRPFAASDTAASEPVAIVTKEFARRYIPSGRVVGARLKMGGSDSGDSWRTVVAVIADIRHAALDQPPRPEVWMPHAQVPDGLLTTWLRGMYAVVRTTVDPASSIPGLRAAMQSVDPELPLVDMRSMDQMAQSSTAERRLETSLLTAFASIALGLAGIGLFGVLAFHVSQHVQEFGVRLALGATPSDLLLAVLRRAMLMLGIGLAIGVPGALLMGRAMSALLYDVAPTDPIALVGSAAILIGVTVLASALPARRAMRTDPLTAIRSE